MVFQFLSILNNLPAMENTGGVVVLGHEDLLEGGNWRILSIL